ncbi:MAG: MqnA/MqnD/SBP family protein [Campylobacterota bacterium]|nr:MqnA/MqnD/SBP family protein [Campylobacterota bacterium]
MIFGRIDYINLLPFHVFMKRYVQSSQLSMSMHYKRGIPSKINGDFSTRRIDAAFISSITAQKRPFIRLGIVAKKSVRSVLVIPHDKHQDDSASASSNVLAQILGVQGRVLIGDEALRYYHKGGEFIDMAELWNERYRLPFVFALLCFHTQKSSLEKTRKHFIRSKIKIPRYLLERASKKSAIAPHDIIDYLELISYDIDNKAILGLKKFWKLSHKS